MKNRTRQNQAHMGTHLPYDEEWNVLSIFEGGPGRPSLRNDYLIHRRETLFRQIEPLWWGVGFALNNARDQEDIRKAFEVIELETNSGPLAPVLRRASEPSTSATIARVRKRLGMAIEKLRAIDCEYQQQLRSHQDSERAVYALSEKLKTDLENELQRRKQNIRGIKVQITQEKARIRSVQLRRKKSRDRRLESHRSDLSTIQNQLLALEKDCQADLNVCRDLESRIRLITPDRRKIVTEEETAQKRLLGNLEQQRTKADIESKELERKLQDQEAFFLREQILKFVRKKKYALTPLNVASAIAGLPYVTSRRSAELCSRLKCAVTHSRDYGVFLFVELTWKQSRRQRSIPLIECFRRGIKRLPKTCVVDGERRTNYLRSYLADNWYFLRRAIEESQQSKFTARGTQYLITAAFLTRAKNAESPAESILAEKTKIMG
jgi:hypothetical protein